MLFNYLEITDLIILDSLLVLIVLFFMFKWFFKEVRSIARESEGFIKFGQTVFILLSWSVFFILLFYYILNPDSINALNIFLTIVVGFLGTSGGFFFSGEALKHLERKVKSRGKILSSLKPEFLDEVKELIEESAELIEENTKLKKKLKIR